MNTSAFASFFKTISEDFDIYRPETSDHERDDLLNKAISLFHSETNNKVEIVSKDNVMTIDALKLEQSNKNNLFMYRPLQKGFGLPFEIPSCYDVFEESTGDIYENYIRTIENLGNQSFLTQDIARCKLCLANYTTVLCWSNTSILLNKVLNDAAEFQNTFVLTYGSPLLLPLSSLRDCINIYHEDDWVIGLVNAYYKTDLLSLERNIVYEATINGGKRCKFVIFSKDSFKNAVNEPHRCFDHFL